MKYMLLVLILASGAAMTGCTNARIAVMQAYGQSHHIKQYSGGQLIGEWDSTGKVLNEKQSDGWYFQDMKTGKITEVSGDIQITIK